MIPFLVAMMLFTGVCNTLLSKYQVCPSLRMLRRPQEADTMSRTYNVSATASQVMLTRSSGFPNLSSRREPPYAHALMIL